MSALLNAIAQKNFAVFGRAGMDLFADPVGTKSEHSDLFRADLGGSSANICVGLVKLGAVASLITSVSDDAVGRFCRNRLKHYGVDTRHVRVIGGEARTSLAVYESVLADFQNVIYRNNAADFQVTESDVTAIDCSRFAALITTGTVLAAQPSRDATFLLLEKARAAGLPVIFDIDYRPYSWPSAEVAAEQLSKAAACCDMIVGNDEEFGFMAGGIERGLAKARDLARQPGRIVIYKMGHKGAITLAGGEEYRTGIYPVEAVKPNGAGDSFLAGLLASIGSGHDLHTAILRGSACASIVVAKPGCAPAMPDRSELDAFIAAHPGPVNL